MTMLRIINASKIYNNIALIKSDWQILSLIDTYVTGSYVKLLFPRKGGNIRVVFAGTD